MKTIFLTSAAIFLMAAPAQAQLLGGGLGGSLGGSLRGTGSLDLPTRTVETVTRTAGSARASTEGAQSVDRRSGRVKADRKASAQGAGSVDQTASTSRAGLIGSAAGSASGSGSIGGEAQLVGTDAVRGLVGGAAGSARGAVGAAKGVAAGALGSAQGIAGGVTGSASGAASGMFSGAAGQLALAGSAAGQGAGTFGVASGMPVSDTDGDRVGFVQRVIADSRGRVESLVVMTEDGPATVPAANFTGTGSLLISAMGEGKLEKVARRQAKNESPATPPHNSP
jgi:hypothetical protein